MPLTIGTAGHIDHGKTWLVRALTGKDTDRLPEEQRRGISIDLGYAPLELPDGRRVSIVDVPGHERFVRAMVAGATGIDLFLLVVDAGEGARPQTLEHLAILRLLGIERGVVAVTKADAVDATLLEAAREEAQELVPDAEVVAVSAKSGAGIDELRAAIGRAAAGVEHERAERPTRLWVDRAFSLRGVGTVVTGTLWSGSIGAGDELRLEPSGTSVRVRSVQVHDHDVPRADAGQRVAVSLPGIERRAVARGEALVAADAYPVSYRLDVALDELEPIPRRRAPQRAPRDSERAGPRDEDRRALGAAPPDLPGRRRTRRPRRSARRDHGRRRRDPRPGSAASSRCRASGPRRARRRRGDGERTSPRDEPSAHRLRGAPRPRACGAVGVLGELARRGSSRSSASASRRRIRSTPASPLRPSLGRPTSSRGSVSSAAARSSTFREPHPRSADVRRPRRRSSRSSPAPACARRRSMTRSSSASSRRRERSSRSATATRSAPTRTRSRRTSSSSECRASGEITLARFRDLVGTGRRDAQLLLERFDRDGLTRRVGDARVLRRGRESGAQHAVCVIVPAGPCFHHARPLSVLETQ